MITHTFIIIITGLVPLYFGQRTCDFGYYSKNNICVPHQCSCGNGTAPEGWACPKNNCEKCLRCNYGYHSVKLPEICDYKQVSFQSDRCVSNQCICSNGVGASGTDCPSHQSWCDM